MIDAGEVLTRWTARGAFALYVVALLVRSGRRSAADPRPIARLIWTLACALMATHVAFAFSVFHHWSHREAYVETARQTKELFGIDWGGGLYFNYLLLLVWMIDVAWWWRDHRSHESRGCIVEWSIQGFLAFMWFNATVVFGQGWIRALGLGGFVALAVGLAIERKRLRDRASL